MFCSSREFNEEDQEWIARREMISKNGARLKAQQFLNELDIFSIARPDETRESEASALQLHEEEPCTASQWKTAVDPHSGRTYYYDAATRKSQWEKPATVRAMEKRAKAEKRRLDRLFFAEMESNILQSLQRGETIPGIATPSKHVKNPPPMVPSIERGKPNRVRTISGMDESLLADLRNGVMPTTTTAPRKPPSTAISASSNKPPSTAPTANPTRGRPPLPTGRRLSSRDVSSESLTLSPDETSPKQDAVRAELAGELILDGPIHETVPVDEQLALLTGQLPEKVHVRRNTGGTIYVKTTMTNPDIQATIKCVCSVYRAHIVQAAEKRSKGSPVSVSMAVSQERQLYNVFLDDPTDLSLMEDLPSLDEIIAFYQDFYQRSQMEHDTIIMSLIYVERLIKETDGQLVPGAENWKSVLFSCMVLASKVWDDLSMWNIDFSNVCGRGHSRALSSFTLPRINELELALLKCFNFIVRVPASQYAKYYFLIRSMLLKSGVLQEGSSHEEKAKPLHSQEVKTLETLAANHHQDVNVDKRRSKSLNDFDLLGPRQNDRIEPALQPSVCLEQLVSMNP